MRKKIWDDDVSEYESFDQVTSNEEDDDFTQSILDEFEDDSDLQKKVAKKNLKNTSYTLNSKETDIMQLAMVQLEQAKLYDMFLKHNLFEGVKANPVALKKVEKELKEFILERMQILLGMKEDKKNLQPPQGFKVEMPFNDVEIEFIKALAFKGTKGESANSSTRTVEAMPAMKSLSSNNLKSIQGNTLKPLDFYEKEENFEEEEEFVETRRVSKPIQRQVRNNKKPVQSTPSTIEELAREDLKKMAKRKPAHEMNESELMEANRNIRTNQPKSTSGMAMPTADALVGHYMGQQANREAISGGGANLNALLMNKLGYSNSVENDGDN